MRSLQHIIAALLLALTLPLGSGAQFVTLEGRRFMLDGQEFYPVVLNYGTEYASDSVGETDPEEIFYSPMSQHGTSVGSHFECDSPESCDQQLRSELAQIAAMGFNTIRLVGTNPKAFRTATGERPYKVSIHPAIPFAPNYHVDITASDFTDPLSERTFLLIERILDAADDAGLKVILLTGTEVKTWPESEDTVNYDIVDRQNYAAYLHRLATALRDHPALLAYDILNEPAWRYTNRNLMDLTKAEVCEWTGVWYDTITTADPNHLVTLGGHSIHEIGTWDPAVMKIDFYSPHIYLEEDWGFAALYDMNVIKEKYLAELYWLGATLEMPWMIGETSFSADDSQTDFGSNEYLDALPEHQVMPYMNGSEAEQAAFVAETMAATRACKGSGYSWWYYQNGRSFRYNQIGTNNITPKSVRSNYFGVLSFGHDQDPGRVKPMAGVVQAYQPEPLPEELPEPPPAYWNWHALPNNVYRTYHLQDQNQEPVANGIALVEWKYRSAINPNYKPSFWSRTVSNDQGELRINKPRPMEDEGFITPEEALQIMVDAPGATGQAVETPWPDEEDLTFNRQLLPFARTLSDLEIIWEAGSRKSAWAELTLHDGVVHASGAENDLVIFEARHWVRATGDFHIGYGSEAQLRTAKTFPDCAYPSWGMSPEPTGPSISVKAREVRLDADLSLRFRAYGPILHAFPNPFSEMLMIQANVTGRLEIRDALGRLIFSDAMQSDRISLDPRLWGPGQYALTLQHEEGKETLRILKAR